jgi:hypothetical protein
VRYRSLTAADRATYFATLETPHAIDVLVEVYDADEALVATLDGNVMSGQVDVDATAAITRSCTLTLMDPEMKATFDPIGLVYADNFLGVTYRVWVPALGDWVDTEVFFGPLSRYSRNGHEVTLEAQGKEALMLPPVPPVAPGNPADRLITSVIRAAAASYGEANFNLSDGGGRKTSRRFQFNHAAATQNGLWPQLVSLAASAGGRQLFYDGAGALTMRPRPKSTPVFTLSSVTSEPSVIYDLTDVRNTVKVYGADKHGRDTLKAKVELPAAHPLSAKSLGRNGAPRVLLEEVRTGSEHLTKADAATRAKRLLAQKSRGLLEVSCESLVVPHLDIDDYVRISTTTIDASFPLRKFTIPLTATDSMSVGFTRPLLKKYRRAHR